MTEKLEPWQTRGPDGKVYGLQPVSDWVDWYPDGKDTGYPELTAAQKKRLEAALGSKAAKSG